MTDSEPPERADLTYNHSTGTLVLDPPAAPTGSAQPRRRRFTGLAFQPPWMVVGLMALAALARFPWIGSAYDINGDEVDYTDLTRSIHHGVFPPQFQHQSFLLHPPLFFAVGAVWSDLLQVHGSYFHQLDALRMLNAVLAVISTGLIYALGSRLAGRWAGAGAALLFALDPYILRQNERVMIETGTAMLVLAGWLVLIRVMDGEARREGWTAVMGGLLLGLSIVAKDVASILVTVPLLAVLASGVGMRRRTALKVLVATIVPYAVYLLLLSINGFFSNFISQETSGIRRELGLDQSTGFNKAGSPSLVTEAIHQLSQFGVTYAVSGLGVVASIYLLARADRPALRIWAVVSLCGVTSLAYSLFFGTIEEQMLYFMYVPALVSVFVAAVIALRRRPEAHGDTWRKVLVLAVAVFAIYDVGVWGDVRATPNDGLARVVSFFQWQPVRPGTIANDTDVTTMLLSRSGFSAVNVTTPQAAAADHVRYLTILSDSVKGHYGSLNQAQAGFYQHYGRRVFRYDEGTYGTVSIYETTDPKIW